MSGFKEIFPRGSKIDNDFFSGTAYLEMLVEDDLNSDRPFGSIL